MTETFFDSLLYFCIHHFVLVALNWTMWFLDSLHSSCVRPLIEKSMIHRRQQKCPAFAKAENFDPFRPDADGNVAPANLKKRWNGNRMISFNVDMESFQQHLPPHNCRTGHLGHLQDQRYIFRFCLQKPPVMNETKHALFWATARPPLLFSEAKACYPLIEHAQKPWWHW